MSQENLDFELDSKAVDGSGKAKAVNEENIDKSAEKNAEKNIDKIDKNIDKSEDAVEAVEKSESDKKDKANKSADEVTLEVRKKLFKKSDLLVLCVCLVLSVFIWLHATNLQKKDDESKLTKDDMIDVLNKGNETESEESQ